MLLKELSDKRKELLLALDRRSIKTVREELFPLHQRDLNILLQILTSLTAAYTRILRDTDPEKAILKQSIASIRHLIMQQSEACQKSNETYLTESSPTFHYFGS